MKGFYNIFSLLTLTVLLTLCTVQRADAFSSEYYAKSSRLSSGKWVRVKVTEDGIYSISQSDISKWGFSNIANVRVFGYGGKQISDQLTLSNFVDDLPQMPVLRDGDRILFYAKGPLTWNYSTSIFKHSQHAYATEGCYFITEDASIEDLSVSKNSVAVSGSEDITTFTEHLVHEQDLVSVGAVDRLLLGEDFKSKSTQTFTFELTDIVTSEKVRTRTSFGAKILNSGYGTVTHSANGTTLDYTSDDRLSALTDTEHERLKVKTSQKTFTVSGSTLSYTLDFNSTGGALYNANLDYIEVSYTRRLNLNGNSLLFNTISSGRYALSNATANTRIWDVSDTAPVEVNAELSSSTLRFTPSMSAYREYVAFNANASYPSPTFDANVSNQNIHAEEIPDLVIITPYQYRTQALNLASMHEEVDSMRVLVVTPDVIYNEFSSGTVDVSAFRHMLKMFYDRGLDAVNPKHTLKNVLLFGRGSYDNRRLTDEVKSLSFPTLPVWGTILGENELTAYITDDFITFLADGSNTNNMSIVECSIGVGRLPVKSETEANVVVKKIVNYVKNSSPGYWQNNILMIADDGNSNDHLTQSEANITTMRSNGGKGYLYQRIYLDAYDSESSGSGRAFPQARKDMFEKFAAGNLAVFYTGHANPTSWTADGLLTYSDIENKFYYKHLPLLYTATCEFTRWDSNTVSGGESFLLNANGGAVALMSTTRVVYITQNGTLSKNVSAQMFKRDSDGRFQTLGLMLSKGKNSTKSDNSRRYSLIGDPAMRLCYPKYTVTVDKINGETVSESNRPDIAASSIVTIEGSVNTPDGNLATDFNGEITPRLYDAALSITTHGYDSDPTTYYEYKNLLYLGNGKVTNGKYQLTFRMPSEILDNHSAALLNMYAKDTTKGVQANGSTNNFFVSGYVEPEVPDTIGPEIKYLGLNSTSFNNGDTVNESPMVIAEFYDEGSGINLSPAGIGHSMTITLDGTTVYSDVSNYYTPDESGQGGKVYYSLSDLSSGNHTLTFKVWDNEKNSSEKSIEFFVKEGLKPEIYDVYTDCNPASVSANFYISHNRPDASVVVTIEVYNLLGVKVWSTTESGRSDMFESFPVTWDLDDTNGNRVSRGIYVYRAAISTDGEQITTKSKKLAVTSGN